MSKLMSLHEYMVRAITHSYEEPWYGSKECVWMAKRFALLVQWIRLGSFNGSAKNATYKKGWTYDPDKRHRFDAGPKVTLRAQDHVILDQWEHWHVWIVYRADKNGRRMIEQNAILGSWTWLGNDAILIHYYAFKDDPILHIFRKK